MAVESVGLGRKQVQEMTVVLGIDPGLSGGFAWLGDGPLKTFPFPSVKAAKGREANWALIADALDFNPVIDHAFIERVGAMPNQGSSSGFKFGFNAGGVRGMVAMLRVPVTYIIPTTWKKFHKLPASKDASRARASELFPANAHEFARVKDDGVAEAALIAYYGRAKLLKGEA